MLNKAAFAISLAVLTGAFHLFLYLAALVVPKFFRFLFNAQFMGADVASLMPKKFFLGNFLVGLISVLVFTWIFGYLWAWLYNSLAS